MLAVTLDEWKKKLESPNREIIILHNPKVKQIKSLSLMLGLKVNSIAKENLIGFLFLGILLRITFGNFYITFTIMTLKTCNHYYYLPCSVYTKIFLGSIMPLQIKSITDTLCSMSSMCRVLLKVFQPDIYFSFFIFQLY